MNDKIKAILDNPWTIRSVIGLLGFGGGVGTGYILAKNKYESKELSDFHVFPEELTFDFDAVDEEPVRPPKVVLTPEVAVEKDILKVNSLSELRPSMVSSDDAEDNEPDPEDDTEPDIIIPEVEPDVEFDYDEELKKRSSTAPYVITSEEFHADELNYTQSSLTYFALDNIMADEDNVPVYNHAVVTGPLLFGHGSGDPDVVYIRNDERRAEYEITKEDKLFSVEVLGLEIENNERAADLKHSKIHKFRGD